LRRAGGLARRRRYRQSAARAEEQPIAIRADNNIIFLCATQYYLFKKELSEAISSSIQSHTDITPLVEIFKKYQDVICLLGNIKNINLTRHSPDTKTSFGSRPAAAGAPRRKRKADASNSESGKAKKIAAASPPTPVINLTEIQRFLEGGSLNDKDKIVWRTKLKKNHRDWSLTSGQTIAWQHTQRQNASDNSRQNLTYRCSLCGCYMFDFNNRNHSPCGHSVELEHQIPGSRAVDMYFDVWETFSKMYPLLGLNNTTDEWLYDYEKEFFENIGHQSEIDNIVVYCCTSCNQVKHHMYPYVATDNDTVNIRTGCFDLFRERLKIIFTNTVSFTEPHGEWGPDTLKECDLTYKLQCYIVWTVQFIYTFMMDDEEKKNHTDNTFGGSFMELIPFINNYQEKVEEIQQSVPNVTPQYIWDIYYDGRSIKGKYFGRPVNNDTGLTLTGHPGFQSLEDKYGSILETLRQRLTSKFAGDNVTLKQSEIDLIGSIVGKISENPDFGAPDDNPQGK
tara:strand:+ start:11260 stop:12783 length:1524 start_codon:yes stop_codon:yes gene_type:complete